MTTLDYATPKMPGQEPASSIGFVELDLPCVGCGYNLRTLAWESQCPECGQRVRASKRRADVTVESIRLAGRVAKISIAMTVLSAVSIAGSFVLLMTGGALLVSVGLAIVFLLLLKLGIDRDLAIRGLAPFGMPELDQPVAWQDYAAGAGLLLLGLAALVAGLERSPEACFVVSGFGFFALTIGVTRFRSIYGRLGIIQRGFDPVASGVGLRGHGTSKMIVDGLLVGLLTVGHAAVVSPLGAIGELAILALFGSLLAVGLYGLHWFVTLGVEITFLRSVCGSAQQRYLMDE